MATMNPFDLLGDDAEDPSSQLIAIQQQIIETKKSVAPSDKKQPNKPAAQSKLPSKPLPPAQSVREAKSEFTQGGRGGGRGYGRGRGAGGGSYRDLTNNGNSYGNREISGPQGAIEESDTGKIFDKRGGFDGPRGPYRGGRRGGFGNGEVGERDQERYGNREISGPQGAIEKSDTGKTFDKRGGFDEPRGPYRGGRRGGFGNGEVGERDQERARRTFDRRSGTGRGNEIKREGTGRGNWGNQTDELAQVTEEVANEGEKSLNTEKPVGEENAAEDGDKEAATTKEVEEKEPEDKEMTLDEYEKVLEEKRKALEALKTEERKVDVKQFQSMQQIASKKTNDDIFVKLGSDKDKKKELAEKEERAKKSVSINEFLKPVEGERYYTPGGRGRGRGSRGGYNGGSEISSGVKAAPSIEDPGQFPTLGGK